MYHEIQVLGRPVSNPEAGYTRYVVSSTDFKDQMGCLAATGGYGMGVTDGLCFPHPEGAVITFDDGCETDLIAAAPILAEANFKATFYLTVGFLGKPGYLSRAQARELSDAGFDIGCHSMTHPYLTDVSPEQLQYEIVSAKTELEQIIGQRVDHFSCPGGRWNRDVSLVAKQAGFRSVANSRAVANSEQTDPFCLGRVAITRGTSLSAFEDIINIRGLWKTRLRDVTQSTAKAVLGNSAYDRLRSVLLDRWSRS